MRKPFDFTPHLCYTFLGKKGDAMQRASFMIRNRVLCRGIKTTGERLVGGYEMQSVFLGATALYDIL